MRQPVHRGDATPKTYVLTVAAHVMDGAPKPPELDHWLLRDWGAPYAGGWMEWPAAEFAHARVARNVYVALSGFQSAPNVVEWADRNPQAWELVSYVLSLREGWG